MSSDFFINQAFDYAIKEFLENESNPDVVKDNSFFVIVIRSLIFIYSEIDVINPYKTNNEKGMGGFDSNLCKFGYPVSEVYKFKDDLQKYFEFYQKQVNEPVKSKIPYLTEVEKDLIDMFLVKNDINEDNLNNFSKLLYTMNNSNTQIKSFNLLYATSINEVENYLRSRMYLRDNKLVFTPIFVNKLDYMIYNHFGIDNVTVDSWNQKQINSVNDQILGYANTSLEDPELLNKMNEILTARKKPKIEINY